MTDTNALRDRITKSGISISFIAREIGISRESFYLKMNNSCEFKASEIACVKRVLNLTNSERDAIFCN